MSDITFVALPLGVMPDVEFGKILYAVFGSKTYASRKLQRTMYWMPKFRHANPYPIPKILPEDKIELAKRALKRMAFDINNEITVWKVSTSIREIHKHGKLSNFKYRSNMPNISWM